MLLIIDRPSCCGRDAGNGGDCVALMTDLGAPVIPCVSLRPSVAARRDLYQWCGSTNWVGSGFVRHQILHRHWCI